MANKKTQKGGGLSPKDRNTLLALDKAFESKIDFPVADILHEARELSTTLAKVGAQITSRTKISKNAGADLLARRALLDAAEAEWNAVRTRTAPKPIVKLRKEAEGLKRDAFEALRYFTSDDGDVKVKLDEIAPGTGDADLIDDLQKLAALVEANAAALKTADLPKNASKALRTLATELGKHSAESAVKIEEAAIIALRNRAYWHLRDLIDAIREAGRYVFRANPRALSLFRASGTRARARQRGKKSPSNP